MNHEYKYFYWSIKVLTSDCVFFFIWFICVLNIHTIYKYYSNSHIEKQIIHFFYGLIQVCTLHNVHQFQNKTKNELLCHKHRIRLSRINNIISFCKHWTTNIILLSLIHWTSSCQSFGNIYYIWIIPDMSPSAHFNNNTQWFFCLIIKFTVNKTKVSKHKILLNRIYKRILWGFMNILIDFSCFVAETTNDELIQNEISMNKLIWNEFPFCLCICCVVHIKQYCPWGDFK